MAECTFRGTAGRLSGKYQRNIDPEAPVAVLMHPAKVMHGNMDQSLMYQVYYALYHRGYSVLRYNMRGVGKSEGRFDDGFGEVEDGNAALDWMYSQCPRARGALVVGFSFGAYVAAQVMARRAEVKEFIFISPPASIYDFSFVTREDIHEANGVVVAAERDQVSTLASMSEMVDAMNIHGEIAAMVTVPGAGHFFEGYVAEVCGYVAKFVESK